MHKVTTHASNGNQTRPSTEVISKKYEQQSFQLNEKTLKF